MLQAGRIAWALLGIAGVAVLVGYVAFQLALVVVPLVLALFPAAALAPAVSWLVRHRVPRVLAALLVVVGLLAAIAGVLTAVVPSFLAQLPALGEAIRQAAQQLQPLLDRLPGQQNLSLQQLAQRAATTLGGGSALSTAIGATRSVVEFLAGMLLLVIALFFYLFDGARRFRAAAGLLPEPRRRLVLELGEQLWLTLGGFFRGQFVVAVIDAVLIGIGLVLLDVPLVLPLAVLVFLGGFFPIVGATVSGLIAVLVALVHGGLGTALAVLAVVVGVQQLEGNIIEPLVMRRMVRVSAFVILVAIAAGAAVLGVLGAFLAVPVAAVVKRTVTFLREQRDRAAEEPAPPDEATNPTPPERISPPPTS